MRKIFICTVMVFLVTKILPPWAFGQAARQPVVFEPVITDEYAIFPVTTELQRSAIGNGLIDVAVFVNGAAFRGVERIDRFQPAFVQLQKKIEDLPKGDNAGIIFNCIDGHVPNEPSDNLGQRLEALSKTSEEVGYYAGYLNVKWSQMFRGNHDWDQFIDQARRRANSADSSEETAVGNHRVQIFPIRTILSGLIYNADCLVNVTPIVTGESQYPEDLVEDLNEYLSQHDYAGRQTMLLSIKVHESGRGQVDQWNEDIEGRKEFARKFGFAECNVNSAYYDQRSMVITAIDPDGRPLEGVQVRLNHAYRPRGSETTSIENEVYTTHHNGRVIVARSGESVDLRLWFTKPGYVPLFAIWATDFQSDGHEIPDAFEVKLIPGTEIGGIVSDEAGQPIEGARVDVCDATAFQFTIVRAGRTPGVRPVRSTWLAEGDAAPITDAAGRWSLSNVPADSELIFDASLGERAPQLPILLRVRHPHYVEFDAIDDPTAAGSPNLRELRDKTAEVVLSKSNAKQRSVNSQAYPD